MRLVGLVFFFAGVSSQALLFWRGCRWCAWRKYPLFFIYLSYTSFFTIFFLFFPHAHPMYARVYWYNELGAAVLRFLVAWEIYRQVFRGGSVVRSIAGSILVGALTLLALVFWAGGPGPGTSLVIDFMRKMALAVATWIVVVIGLAGFYAIPIGRNIWGMAIGFLIFAASQIANFAAFDLSPRFGPIWPLVHPFSYLCMLAVWVWSLWNYAPNPELRSSESSMGPEAISEWQERSAALNKIIRKVINP